MENKKYYTNSKGERVDVATLETTHLANAMRKKYEGLFSCGNKKDFSTVLKEVNNLKDEYHKRLNEYYDKLGD